MRQEKIVCMPFWIQRLLSLLGTYPCEWNSSIYFAISCRYELDDQRMIGNLFQPRKLIAAMRMRFSGRFMLFHKIATNEKVLKLSLVLITFSMVGSKKVKDIELIWEVGVRCPC